MFTDDGRVSADEQALSPAGFLVCRHLPWPHINLLAAALAAALVGLFEGTIAHSTAVALLLPVVAGQAGYAGALAMTIRGLALREIGLIDWLRVLWKESVAGAVKGAVLAVRVEAGGWVWSQSFASSLVIATVMIFSVFAAATAGALLPIPLTRWGRDPATAPSILHPAHHRHRHRRGGLHRPSRYSDAVVRLAVIGERMTGYRTLMFR